VRSDLAALFVSKDSIYKKLIVDFYDVDRDARTYSGELPVIAHPPCQLWGKMARVNYARYGGEHNRPGNDGGLFEFALDTVNRCGGVLEHPASTYAWAEYGLTRPVKGRWIHSGAEGWVCEVCQSAYGHQARKKTWLYYVGVNPPIEADWSCPEGTHQVGYEDTKRPGHNKPTVSKKMANATPEAFARFLIDLVVGKES
jgi:hypothetical protein